MSESGIVLEEVSEWLSYEPVAGRRAFRLLSLKEEEIIVEMSTVTKMITNVLKFAPIFQIPWAIHRADWYRHLDGPRLEALKQALG